MAGFCTKCGSPLASNTGFCPACGNPIAPIAAPVQPGFAPVPETAVQPVAPPPSSYQATPGYTQVNAGTPPPPAGYPPAAAYPATKSGSGLKIVLIVVAVVVGIGVLAAGAFSYLAYRVSKSVSVNTKGDGVTVSVPGAGTFSAGNSVGADADLGVPAYPGSVRETGGVNVSSAKASMVMAHFTTGDSPSQVVSFYKSTMGEGTVAVESDSSTVLNSGGKDTDRVMVTVGPGSGDEAGKTTIVVMHTKKGGDSQ